MNFSLRYLAAITGIALITSGSSPAASPVPRPIHVLYVAHEKSDVAAAKSACAAIMEDLGRDAIYLDFLNKNESAALTDDDASRYDLIINTGDAKDAKALRRAVEDKVKPEILSARRSGRTIPR